MMGCSVCTKCSVRFAYYVLVGGLGVRDRVRVAQAPQLVLKWSIMGVMCRTMWGVHLMRIPTRHQPGLSTLAAPDKCNLT